MEGGFPVSRTIMVSIIIISLMAGVAIGLYSSSYSAQSSTKIVTITVTETTVSSAINILSIQPYTPIEIGEGSKMKIQFYMYAINYSEQNPGCRDYIFEVLVKAVRIPQNVKLLTIRDVTLLVKEFVKIPIRMFADTDMTFETVEGHLYAERFKINNCKLFGVGVPVCYESKANLEVVIDINYLDGRVETVTEYSEDFILGAKGLCANISFEKLDSLCHHIKSHFKCSVEVSILQYEHILPEPPEVPRMIEQRCPLPTERPHNPIHIYPTSVIHGLEPILEIWVNDKPAITFRSPQPFGTFEIQSTIENWEERLVYIPPFRGEKPIILLYSRPD